MGHPAVRLESDPLRGSEKPTASNKPEQASVKLCQGCGDHNHRAQLWVEKTQGCGGKEGGTLSRSALQV